MGLFDKKFCDVCGNKIGLLGNRKLEDGNLCKDCAKKLSPWFSERRHSTLNEIKAQLDYREQNKAKVAAFYTSKTLGNGTKLMIDYQKRQFMVAKTNNISEENPDVLDFSMARGCETIIDEHRNEKKRKDANGSYVSYVPPRYEYSYTMKVKIYVDNPYFDEIVFDISNGYINTGEVSMTGNGNWTVNRVGVGFTDSRNMQKYNDCVQLGNEIKAEIDRMQGGYTGMGQQDPIAQAQQIANNVNNLQQQAAGNVAFGAQYGNQQYGNQQYGAQPMGQQYGNQQYGAQPMGQQYGNQQYGARPMGQQYGNLQYGAQPMCQQYGNQQYGAQPMGQQYGNQQYGAQPAAQQYQAQPAADGPWECPFCGTQNTGKICEGCGAKRP